MKVLAFCFVVAILLLSSIGHSVEYGYFLEDRGLKISLHAKSPAYNPSMDFESYTATDVNSNHHFVLIPPTTHELHQIFMAGQLAEILEIPHIPFSPTLLRRGHNGLPGAVEASRIFENASIRVTDPKTEWLPALVAPLLPQDVYFYKPGDALSPSQLVQLLNHFIYSWVFGFKVYKTPMYQNGSLFVPLSPGIFDQLTGPAARAEVFKKALDRYNRNAPGLIPVEQVKALLQSGDEAAIEQFGVRLNNFISRLVALSEVQDGKSRSHIEEMFDSTIRLMLRPGEIAQTSARLALIRNRVRNLHDEVEAWLEKMALSYRGKFPKLAGFRLNPSFVRPGEFPIAWNAPIPTVQESESPYYAKDRLLTFLFAEEARQKQLLVSWSEALGVPDPIEKLWHDAATYDNSIYLGMADSVRTAGVQRKGKTGYQWYLNRNLRGTTFVVYPFSRENELISEIIAEIQSVLNDNEHENSVLVYPYIHADRKERSLSRLDHDAIVRFAKKHGHTRVMICNFGVFDTVKREGITFSYFDRRSQSAKVSVAEGIANAFGYQLSFPQWLSVILNRSGFTGFHNSNYSKVEVAEALATNSRMLRLQRIPEEIYLRLADETGSINPRRLYRYYASNGKAIDVQDPLAYWTYPAAPHVLFHNRYMVEFTGPYELCLKLKKTMESEVRGDFELSGDRYVGFLRFFPTSASPELSEVAVKMEARARSLHQYEGCSVKIASGTFQ